MTETTSPDIGKRRRRFRRDPQFRSERSRAGRIELQSRDLEIIAAVARYRFMNTVQICRMFGCDCPPIEKLAVRASGPALIRAKQHRETCVSLFKNDQHIAHRLRELFHQGYLERPVSQLQLRVRDGAIAKGSVSMVYCISKSGLDIIGSERRAALGAGKLSWVGKINEGGRVFMEHTLAVGGVSVGLDVVLRRQSRLVRLNESSLQSGMSAARRASPKPWSMRVKHKGEDLTALCDLAFAVGDPTTRQRWNFLVEVDRGHMPVVRASFHHTSIMRKLVAYAKAFEDGLHQSEFGWQNFRVVVLTTSTERVGSCVDAVRARFGTASVARIFLFGVEGAADDLLSYEFVDGLGRAVRLIEPST